MIWPFKPKIIWHLPEGRNDLMPLRATAGAMAYDLVSPTTELVPANHYALINTLVAVTIPKGYAIILGSRSGMASKDRITVEAGWIDEDYRGMIKVLLYNHSNVEYFTKMGQRIAQALLVKTYNVNEIKSFVYPDTKATKRGAGGFGSTGK